MKLGGEDIRLEPEEWKLWVADGRVPPETPVLAPDGTWVPAGSLPVFRRLTQRPELPPAAATGGFFRVIFPRRGFSATEALLLVNLAVAAFLLLRWGADYPARMAATVTGWWEAVATRRAFWWWVPTLFLHAGPRHLGGNMVSLAAAAGAVEFLCGRRWTLAGYLATGLAGAAVSYRGHGGPPLSIGASGAVFGIAGMVIAFVARRHGSFTYRQRWKTRRVYAPLFVLFVLPSVLQADYYAHVGGLVAGLVLGMVAPMHPRIREQIAEEEHDGAARTE